VPQDKQVGTRCRSIDGFIPYHASKFSKDSQWREYL